MHLDTTKPLLGTKFCPGNTLLEEGSAMVNNSGDSGGVMEERLTAQAYKHDLHKAN